MFFLAADFDPGSQSSRVKVELADRILTVMVDPKNSKTWEACAKVLTAINGWTLLLKVGSREVLYSRTLPEPDVLVLA